MDKIIYKNMQKFVTIEYLLQNKRTEYFNRIKL